MQTYVVTGLTRVCELKSPAPCCGGAKGNTGTGIVSYVHEKVRVQQGLHAAVDECLSGIGV